MALFDFLRRAREKEQERQSNPLANIQGPQSRISSVQSQAPSPSMFQGPMSTQRGAVSVTPTPAPDFSGALSQVNPIRGLALMTESQPIQGGPRSTQEGRVLPIGGGREQIFPVAPSFSDAPVQSLIQDPLRVSGLRDNLIRQGRDTAAANATALAAMRTGLDIVPVRPLVQTVDALTARTPLGTTLADQPKDIQRPNIFSDVLLADRQGQRSGGPFAAGVSTSQRGLELALDPQSTVPQYAAGLGLFAAGPIIGGADFVPGGRGVTRPARNLLEETAETASQRAVRNLLEETGQMAPRQLQFPQTQAPADVLAAVREGIPRRTIGEGAAIRSLPESIRESTAFDEIASTVPQQRYQPISNQQTLREAEEYLNTFNTIDEAYDELMAKPATQTLTRQESASYKILADALQERSDYRKLEALFNKVSERATATGQATQALSLFGRLTPTGALRFADNLVDNANKAFGRQIKSGKFDKVNITDADRADIANQAKKVQDILAREGEESAEFAIESAVLANTIDELVPATLAEKLRTYRNISLLLNAKTSARNILGGLSAVATEAVSRPVARAVDLGMSLFTGQRAVGRRGVLETVRGAREGAEQAVREVQKGVDLQRAGRKFEGSGRQMTFGRYDLEKGKVVGRDANTPVGRLINGGLARAEKALNYSLKVSDRGIFEAIYKSELAALARTAPDNIPEEALIEEALYQSSRATSQDPNLISNILLKTRDAFNYLGVRIKTPKGTKSFGLGDAIFAFTQVPGAILRSGIEMTPIIGQLWSAKEIYDIYKYTDNPDVFRWLAQKRAAESAGRGVAGGSLIGLGGVMSGLGLITSKRSDDPDEANLENVKGLRDYSLNIDGLGRWLTSGLDPEAAAPQQGDRFVNYDLLQPAAHLITIGADMESNGADSFYAAVLNSTLNSMNAIFENPLFKSIKDISRTINIKNNIPSALLQAGLSIPSSFIPTVASQVRYFLDPKLRQTFDQDLFAQTMYSVMNRIPGLSQKLPARYDIFGEPAEVPADSISQKLYNSFLNPFITTEYNNEPAIQLLEDIADEVGDNNFYPRRTTDSLTIPGVDGKARISNELQAEMQRNYGFNMKNFLDSLTVDEEFAQLNPEEKAKVIEDYEDELYNQGIKYDAYAKSIGVDIPSDASLFAAADIIKNLRGTNKEDREYWDALTEEEKASLIQEDFNNGLYDFN